MSRTYNKSDVRCRRTITTEEEPTQDGKPNKIGEAEDWHLIIALLLFEHPIALHAKAKQAIPMPDLRLVCCLQLYISTRPEVAGGGDKEGSRRYGRRGARAPEEARRAPLGRPRRRRHAPVGAQHYTSRDDPPLRVHGRSRRPHQRLGPARSHTTSRTASSSSPSPAAKLHPPAGFSSGSPVTPRTSSGSSRRYNPPAMHIIAQELPRPQAARC